MLVGLKKMSYKWRIRKMGQIKHAKHLNLKHVRFLPIVCWEAQGVGFWWLLHFFSCMNHIYKMWSVISSSDRARTWCLQSSLDYRILYIFMIYMVIACKSKLVKNVQFILHLSMIFNLQKQVLSFCSHFLSLHNIEFYTAVMIINATDSNRFGKRKLLVRM